MDGKVQERFISNLLGYLICISNEKNLIFMDLYHKKKQWEGSFQSLLLGYVKPISVKSPSGSFENNLIQFYISKLIDISVIISAMLFRFKNRVKNFSFIDCFGYILEKENGLIFLTGDQEFEGIKGVEYVKWV